MINPHENNILKKFLHYIFSFFYIRLNYLFFDVIYLHKTCLSNIELFFIKKLFKKKIIISIDDLPPKYMLIINPKFVDLVLCGSEYLKEMFESKGFVAVFWPTTIPKDKLLYRNMGSHKNDKIILGWIGSSGGEKYIPTIIDVLDKLRKKYNFIFKVVTLEKYFKNFPKEIISKDYICFENWDLKKEWEYFDEIDILIMPLDKTERSKAKGGFKILQAMFRGVVPIAYDTKANSYFIRDGYNGFLYKNKNELEYKLKLLLEKDELRRKFILNSYKILEEKKLYLEDKVEELWKYLKDQK